MVFPLARKNVQKRKPHPKDAIDDRAHGLWIDYDLLRKHQGRSPEFVSHAHTTAGDNRYLELADIALGNKAKKKAKGKAAAD